VKDTVNFTAKVNSGKAGREGALGQGEREDPLGDGGPPA